MKIDFSKAQTVPTQKQINYINLLANDLGFSLEKRRAWIEHILNRTIPSTFLDEISKEEASIVINAFLQMKEESHP